jgi:hypothetical protein
MGFGRGGWGGNERRLGRRLSILTEERSQFWKRSCAGLQVWGAVCYAAFGLQSFARAQEAESRMHQTNERDQLLRRNE